MLERSAAGARVLDAAMDLFERKGFASTSIPDIEEASGLSVGAGGIYRHFRSKAELLEAGVRDLLAVQERALASPIAIVDLGLRDELTLYVRVGLVMIRSQRRLIRLLYRDLEPFPELYAEVKARLVYTGTSEFGTRLRHLAEHHRLNSRLDFDAMATLFVGAVTNIGVIGATLDEQPPVGDDRFVAVWVDALHGVLTGGGE